MKVSLIQVVLAVILAGVTLARPVRGQEILYSKVHIFLTNVSLENALSELEKSAQVKFSYNSRTLKLAQRVNVVADNEALCKVLDKLLKPLNIRYVQVSSRIVLR